jgi:hypothetical protein
MKLIFFFFLIPRLTNIKKLFCYVKVNEDVDFTGVILRRLIRI